MKSKHFIAVLVSVCFQFCSLANNIQVTNVILTGQNTTLHTVQVQFTLSWENSWRVTAGPGNWDAAWVFIKYRVGGGPWLHASLNVSGHIEPAGSTITTGLLTPGSAFNATTNPGLGAFVYRNANGSGTFTVTNAQLQWNYGANALGDNDVVDVKVFAIEHIYVPQAAFAVGDGLSDASQFTLTTINTSTANTAPSGSGSLGGQAGGYPTGQIAPANSAWPNGFSAFYCMKYEISQQGYVDFLNTLGRLQQTARVGTDVSAGNTSITNRYVMSNSATITGRNSIRCDATISSGGPITFYCDYDGDGTGGTSTDGKDITCNYLNPADVGAYLHWAGLRPMTELEYEKCARGNLLPVAGEFAWGSLVINYTTTINNAGLATEKPNAGANVAYGVSGSGPLRVGSIAGSATNREEAGSGYYGIMELSGNVFERVVTIGNTSGRSFLGTHGNGLLLSNGNYTNADWPAVATGDGFGVRGGTHNSTEDLLRVSHRGTLATNGSLTRSQQAGGRGCRTAL